MQAIHPGALRHMRAALLALLGLLWVSGCSAAASRQLTPLPAGQQVLRLGILASQPPQYYTLDPAQAADQNDAFLTLLIFPPLLTVNANLQVEPWAATAMPTFDAATNSYIFTLRPNLAWSDGTPITAATYAYSLNRSLSPCTNAPDRWYLYPILDAQAFADETCAADGTTVGGKLPTLIGTSLLAPNDQTLILRLAAPAPYLLQALTTPVAFAQPQQLITRYGPKNWTQHLTGNGGFGGNLYLVKSWEVNPATDLGQLSLYCRADCQKGTLPAWGGHAAPPVLRELDVTLYTASVIENEADEVGQLDAEMVPGPQYRDSATGSTFQAVPALAITMFYLNWNIAPFDDLRVRQAFDLALDKDELAQQVDQGFSLPTNHLVPQGMYGYDPGLVGPDGRAGTGGDFTEARALLQQYAAERCGGRLSNCPAVDISTCYVFSPAAYVQAAVQMWHQAFPGYPISLAYDIGCPLISSSVPPLYLPQFAAATIVADYADPQDWLSLPFGTGSIDSPIAGNPDVVVPAANRLMSAADLELAAGERATLYNWAEQLLVTNVAAIPIMQEETYYIVQSTVAGFEVTALGYPSLDQMYRIQLVEAH
ncbi:MAG: ABC transporter substrate-binding protein [Ktedonobacterales bacterium]